MVVPLPEYARFVSPAAKAALKDPKQLVERENRAGRRLCQCEATATAAAAAPLPFRVRERHRTKTRRMPSLERRRQTAICAHTEAAWRNSAPTSVAASVWVHHLAVPSTAHPLSSSVEGSRTPSHASPHLPVRTAAYTDATVIDVEGGEQRGRRNKEVASWRRRDEKARCEAGAAHTAHATYVLSLHPRMYIYIYMQRK